jgi:hypothetical protein
MMNLGSGLDREAKDLLDQIETRRGTIIRDAMGYRGKGTSVGIS